MNAVCVYHDKDFDGMGSACIVKKWLDVNNYKGDFVGWDYGRPVPVLEEYDMVFVVAIFLGLESMKHLSEVNRELIWIDHHKSAIDEYEKWVSDTGENFMRGLWTPKKAAIENCWEYLFAGDPMPKYIELLGKYDSWRGNDTPEWNDEIYPFQLYCKSKFSDWKTMYEFLLTNDEPKMIPVAIEFGKAIAQYVTTEDAFRAKNQAYERTFDGLRAICQVGVTGSPSFDAVYDPNKHDIMIAMRYDGTQWSNSIYTTHDHIDCSEICKRHGGGGHRKASGFRSTDMSQLL